jgi:hypothetical protein
MTPMDQMTPMEAHETTFATSFEKYLKEKEAYQKRRRPERDIPFLMRIILSCTLSATAVYKYAFVGDVTGDGVLITMGLASILLFATHFGGTD